MRKRVVALGSNFGGLMTALALKHDWIPFGGRTPDGVTFKVEPFFTKNGINFIHEPALSTDPEGKKVVIPSGNAHTITTLEDAIRAGEGWQKFLKDPGDVVIAASQGAGCFGATYEFLFNTSHQLRKAGIKKQVKLTYVTNEPFLGHFGIGGIPHGQAVLGMFLKKEKIAAYTNTSLEYVDKSSIRTTDGKDHPFKYAMVRPTYQTDKYDDIYAVGIAAGVSAPWATPTPIGIPKTRLPTEAMAHTAVSNIAAQIKGEPALLEKDFADMFALCVLDAGNNGVIILADKMLPPRKHGVLIPGPQAHVMKLGFEKYFMWKSRKGYVRLP